jgi:hypothetical protein
LDDDPIAVRVFKGPTLPIPVGIERRNRREARSLQPTHCRLPFLDSGQVKDQQVLLRWGSPGNMAMRFRELEMVWCARAPEHDAVKAIMFCKPVQDVQA